MAKPVISIDGQPVQAAELADCIEIEPGVYSVIANGRSHEVVITNTTVEIDGASFAFAIDDPRKWRPRTARQGAHGAEQIKAPMPGKVVRVLVAAGDRVEAAQGLIVVEAMKMQNELKSPRAGQVASVAVHENDTVNAGTVLLILE